MKTKLTTLLALAVAGGLLHGQSSVYDGFSVNDYTANETINALGGGSGWTGNWAVNLSNENNALRYQGSSVSLGYTDSVGNSLITTPGSLELHPGGAGGGELSRSFDSAFSGEVWVSFLNIRTQNGSWNWQIQFADAGGAVQVNVQNASNTGRFRLQAGGETSGNMGILNYDTDWAPGDDAQLYLMQITNVGSGSADAGVTLWANPNNLEDLTAGAAASLTLSGLQLNDISQFIFNKGAGVDQVGFFDELRIGTSAADVLPIPEPRFYAALFGMLALAFVVYRKRRAQR